MRRFFQAGVSFLLALFAVAAFGQSVAALPHRVHDALAAQGLPVASLAVRVVRLRDGEVVLDKDPQRPMAPASTMKLVTTAAALHLLGPTFRAKTEMLTEGVIENRTLKGDLIVRGGADFDLTAAAFGELLEQLRFQGVERIEGDIVFDRSRFNPPRLDVGVPPFDEAPEFRYNLIPDALNLNANLIQFDLQSDSHSMKVRSQPELDRVQVHARFSLIEAPCARWEEGWKVPLVETSSEGQLTVVLHGTFPKNCTRRDAVNVLDRAVFAERMFLAKWKELGGSHSGKVREGTASDKARVLVSRQSRPLNELLPLINKPSDNPWTRLLYLELGVAHADLSFARAPTLERSDAAMRTWLRSIGVNDEGAVFDNGSGLSRSERLTPAQLIGLLKYMDKSQWNAEFAASLPLVGLDGTLRNRLKDTPAQGWARLKTGTLRDTSALAGYVTDRNGERYALAAMVNDPKASHALARPALDALVLWIFER